MPASRMATAEPSTGLRSSGLPSVATMAALTPVLVRVAIVIACTATVTAPLRANCAIDSVIASPDARAEGFGQVVPSRLSLMASQVSDAYGTKTRVNPEAVWNGSFLPGRAELDVLPAAKK